MHEVVEHDKKLHTAHVDQQTLLPSMSMMFANGAFPVDDLLSLAVIV